MVIERTVYSDKVMNALVAAGCTVEGAIRRLPEVICRVKNETRGNLEDTLRKEDWDISIPMTPTRKQ